MYEIQLNKADNVHYDILAYHHSIVQTINACTVLLLEVDLLSSRSLTHRNILIPFKAHTCTKV